MKLKVNKDKKTGHTQFSYYKVKDPIPFRCTLLTKILMEADTDATLIIDTNQRIDDVDYEALDAALTETGMVYQTWSVKPHAGKFLGFNAEFMKKKRKKSERMYLLDVTAEQMSDALFVQWLGCFDYGIGFGRKTELDAVREELKAEPEEEVLYGENFFAQTVYDSVLCSSVRCTFDIAPVVRQMGY